MAREGRGGALKLVFSGLLLALVLMLVVQNDERVVTEVLVWSFEAPRFILLAGVFLVGILLGYILGRRTRVG